MLAVESLLVSEFSILDTVSLLLDVVVDVAVVAVLPVELTLSAVAT